LFDFPTGHQGSPVGEESRDQSQVAEGGEPESKVSARSAQGVQQGLFEGQPVANDVPTVERYGSQTSRSESSEELGPAPEGWPLASDGESIESAEPALRAAGVGSRLLGGAADVLLQVTVLSVAIGAMMKMGLPASFGLWPGYAVFMVVFSFLYVTLPLAFWGSTPGMAWRGLRSQDHDGQSLTFAQTVLRWVASLVTVALLGLPVLLAFWQRSLADRMSGSVTVMED